MSTGPPALKWCLVNTGCPVLLKTVFGKHHIVQQRCAPPRSISFGFLELRFAAFIFTRHPVLPYLGMAKSWMETKTHQSERPHKLMPVDADNDTWWKIPLKGRKIWSNVSCVQEVSWESLRGFEPKPSSQECNSIGRCVDGT